MSSRRQATAVAVMLLVAACTNGGTSDDEPEAVLRVGVAGVDSLDPATAAAPDQVLVAGLLFDTLVDLDPTTNEPVPGLATEWSANEEQTEFTFVLRDDTTFHDGTPITAADVKATLERVADPATESPLAPNLSGVEGYETLGAGDASGLAGITTPDDETVVISLVRSFASLPAALAHPGLGIVPASSEDAVAALADEPIGSGPFQLTSTDDDTRRLERFDDHRPDRARLDAVEVTTFATVGKAFRTFRDGELDLTTVPLGRVGEAAEEYGTKGMVPYLAETFLALNLRGTKFDEPAFREAVVLAIDADGAIDAAYDDGVIVARGLVPRGVPGVADDACAGLCTFDLDEAKRLVGEAFPDGEVPIVQIDYLKSPANKAMVTVVQDQLTEAGIPAEVRSHPADEYAAFLASGDAELFLFGWVGDYPSPAAFLPPVFFSASAENVIGLQKDAVDALLDAAEATADGEESAQRYQEAERAILEQFVAVPLVQFETRLVAAESVRGLAVDALGAIDSVNVTVDQ